MMKKAILASVFLLSVPTFAIEEDWKGEPTSGNVQLSAQAGLGGYNDPTGMTFIGGAAFKVVPQGLLEDVNEVGFVELQFGHTFLEGNDPWPYSLHYRWDFQRNIEWTFYGLGGLGGHFGDKHAFSSEWAARPRFGIGALWSPFIERASLRFEIASDRATAGMQFDF